MVNTNRNHEIDCTTCNQEAMMASNYPKIPASEVTPEHIFLNRRKFMVGAGSAVGALALAACAPSLTSPAAPAASSEDSAVVVDDGIEPVAGAETDELGDPLNTFQEITNYNNYYEFSVDTLFPYTTLFRSDRKSVV